MPSDELERAHQKARTIVLLIITAIVAAFLIKYIISEKYYNRYTNSVAATLYSQQASSGYIVVSGDITSRQTQVIVALLKIYGLTPTVEMHEGVEGTAIVLAENMHVDQDTILDVLRKMKIVDFHPGYDKDVPILYAATDSDIASKVKELLAGTGRSYAFVDLKSDDPAIEGIRARLYISGYLPFKDINQELSGIYLEYHNKVYPYPDLLPIVRQIK